MSDVGAGRPHVLVQGLGKQFDGTPVLAGVDLEVPRGTICVLLGPSGSGKTTLLRLVAGLERADSGTIAIGDTTVTGPESFVAPERRRVGMVFQDWALFPHLSVAANVAFGLKGQRGTAERVAEVLGMVGLDSFGDRHPGTLSGGQQQRVALARALAPSPDVLLLDEPFSNLDVALRGQVRSDVHRLLGDAGITAIFVTHDQQEAFALGDQVAVMRDGRIIQAATPRELYTRPADLWIASFVGDANRMVTRATDGVAVTAIGSIDVLGARDGEVEIVVRPEHVVVEPGEAGTVELVEYGGHDTMVTLHLDDGTVILSRVQATDLRRHDRVSVRYAGPPAPAFPAT